MLFHDKLYVLFLVTILKNNPFEDLKAVSYTHLDVYKRQDINNTYAFGDSFNDEAMLSFVKNAIVMKNSDPELYKLASFVTKDIDDNGIYYAMKHFNLI